MLAELRKSAATRAPGDDVVDDDETIDAAGEIVAELRQAAADGADADDDNTVGADSKLVARIRHLGPLSPPVFPGRAT